MLDRVILEQFISTLNEDVSIFIKERQPKTKIKEDEVIAICCAHRDTVLYPLAQISLELEGRPIEMETTVSDTLPMGVLLGTGNSTS